METVVRAARAASPAAEAAAESGEENGRLVQLTWNLRAHLTQVSQQLEVMQAQRTKLVSYTRFLEQQLADERARTLEAASRAPSEAQEAPARVQGGNADAEVARRVALALLVVFLAWRRQRQLNKGLAHGVRQARGEAEALQEANDELRRMAEEHGECMRRQAAAREAPGPPHEEETAGQQPGATVPPKPFPDSDEEARFQDFAASMGFASTPAATPIADVLDALEKEEDEELERGRSESAGELGKHRKRPRTTSAPAPHAPEEAKEQEDEEEDGRPVISDAEVLDDLVQMRKKLESFQILLKLAEDEKPAAVPPRAPLSQSGPGWGSASTNNSDGALPVNRQLALGRGPRPEWEKHRRRCSRLFRALVDPVESGLVSPATAAGRSSR